MIANVCIEGVHWITIEPATNKRSDFIKTVSNALNLSPNQFYFTQNGKLVHSDSINVDSSPIHVCMRLLGGKGGFGSMLRAIGAQIEKTTNREACRDLSGRRLRDINEEKRLKDYLEKQKNQQEDEAAKVARKIERLRSKPKHEFKDDEYFETRSNLLDDVSSALEDGLKKATSSSVATTSAVSSGSGTTSGDNDSNDAKKTEAGSSGTKRKNLKPVKKQKKKLKGAQWLDEGLSSDDSSDGSDDDSSNDSSKDLSTKNKDTKSK